MPTPASRSSSSPPRGRRLLARLPLDVEEWVPELYPAEVAAALSGDAIHARYPSRRIEAALGRLLTAPVRQVEVRPLLPEARSMLPDFTVAGAVYVVLVRRLDAPLVTADLRLSAMPGVPISTMVP